MTKKTLNICVGTIKPYNMEGKIDDSITLLQRVKENYPDAILSWQYEDQYSAKESFCVITSREETDDEYQKRINEENTLTERKISDLQKRAEKMGFKLVAVDSKEG